MNRTYDIGIMLITAILIMVMNQVLGWNFFVCILISVPLLLVFFITSTILFNSRADLKPEPIPQEKFSAQLQNMNQISIQLKENGFDRIDDFYLYMMPETVVYVFKHRELPVFFCLYGIGSVIARDIITFFKGEYTLTSTASASGGNLPRGERAFLQIFPDIHQDKLLENHTAAIDYLKTKGFEPITTDEREFREKFRNSMAQTWARVKTKPFWPLLVLYWSFVNVGKIYMKPIEQQVNEGIVKL